ncbi:MAG: cache domain-containing protein [Janthinobacterium lividum]
MRSCKRIASSALSFHLAGALAVGLGCASAASAADRGSAEDAQAMLARAAARYQEVGKTQALEEFTSDKARFNDRDLYVYCMNLSDSHWTAHGVNRVLVGRDLASVKDADGQSIGDAILVAVRDKPSATIRYKWPDPVTRKVLPKLTFLQKMGDQVCGVGVYEGQSQP